MDYEPPLLDIQEILSSFRQCRIELNESDLTRPDARRWREIYTQIFESLTRISIEQATQSVCRPGMMRIDHPEIYEEGFSQFAFTLCMQRVLYGCGFTNFSVKDVISPTPKRVVKIASSFINTQRHNDMRNLFIAEIRQSVEQSRDEYEAVLKRQKELENRLRKANETKQHREAEIQRHQEEFQEAEEQLMELSKQQEILMKSVEDLNMRLAEKATVKDNVKQLIAVQQQEAEKLSNKIVQSPERFKQEQERLKKRILELKSELTRKEQIVSENRQLLEQTESKRLTAEKAVKLSRDVQEELEKENEFSSDIHLVKESHNELSELHNRLWAQEEDLAEKLAVRYEQKRKIMVQSDVSKNQSHQRLAEMRQLLMKRDEDIKNVKAEEAQIKEKTTVVFEDVRSQEEALEDKRETWKNNYRDMLNEIDILHTLAANGYATLKEELLG